MKNSGSLLAEAVKTIAEEALQAEKSHPSASELEGFAARKLSTEQMDRIEGHIALCPLCADAVLEQMESSRQLKPTPPRRSFFQSIRLAYSLASLFLVAFLAALFWTWLPRSPQPGLNVHIESIAPSDVPGAAERRGIPSDDQFHLLRIPEGADSVLLLLGLAELRDFDSYRLEMLEADETDGEVIWSTENLSRMPAGNFTVELPAGYLLTGRYLIRLSGILNGQQEDLAEYFVRLE